MKISHFTPAVLLAAALLAMPARAQDEQAYILPGDVVMHLTTGPLEPTMQAVDDYAVNAVRGTMLGARMQPGQLIQSMPLFVGVSLDMLDGSKPVQVLGFNPKGLDDDQARLAAVFPLADMAGKKEQLIAGGWQFDGMEGDLHKVRLPTSPGQVVYAKGVGQQTVLADQAEVLRHAVAKLEAWELPVLATPGVQMRIDIAKVVDAHSDELQEKLDTALEEIPTTDKMAREVAGTALSQGHAMLRGMRQVRVEMLPTKQHIRLAAFLQPRADTKMGKVVADLRNGGNEYKLLKHVPKESAVAFAVDYAPALNELVSDWLTDIITDLEHVGTAEQRLQWAQWVKEIAGQLDGEMVSGVYLDSATATQVSYGSVADPDAYVKTMAEMAGWANQLLADMMKMQQTGIEMKLQVQEQAGEVAGVPYGSLTFDVAAPDQANPAINQFMQNVLPSTLFAGMDGTIVTVAALKQAESALGKAIEMLRADVPDGIIAKPSFARKLRDSDSNLMFGAVYLLDYLKLVVVNQSTAIPQTAGQPGQLFQTLANVARSLPNSTQPITFDGHALEGGYRMGTEIPAIAIRETVQAAMQGYMTFMFMQQQQQGGGNAPPMQ